MSRLKIPGVIREHFGRFLCWLGFHKFEEDNGAFLGLFQTRSCTRGWKTRKGRKRCYSSLFERVK